MSTQSIASRRSFLKGGAVAAAPLAVAIPAAALASQDKARLSRLEDQAAIRELHQDWLRGLNRGASTGPALAPEVRSLAADHAGEPDLIEIAEGGGRARGRFHFVVELETELPGGVTLVQMARLQGGGRVRRSERRVLSAEYVKAGGAWKVARLEFA